MLPQLGKPATVPFLSNLRKGALRRDILQRAVELVRYLEGVCVCGIFVEAEMRYCKNKQTPKKWSLIPTLSLSNM